MKPSERAAFFLCGVRLFSGVPFRLKLSANALLVSLLLALLTLCVFWRVSFCGFVNYDDPDYVTANHFVQMGLRGESIKWAFQSLHGMRTYWHPLTWLSHMLDVELFGMRPQGHHL